jgi:uncharacterized membrane protein YfcA
MFEPAIIGVIAGAFLIGGTVKGVIGLGLPSVSLALLAITIDLTTAMALITVPTFLTNVWQALVGGNARVIVVRLWPFLFMAAITVWIGTLALTRVDLAWLSALLGVLLVIYSAVNLIGLRFTIPPHYESWLGPLLGSVNGVLMGMTGSAVVPGVMYLQAVGLSRDVLVQAMGMLFMVSGLTLSLALLQNAILTFENGMVSIGALIPAIIGMVIGQRIRQNLSESLFRKVFFVSLLVLGMYIIVKAISTTV